MQTAKLGEGTGGGASPYFLLQMQFLTAFFDHTVPNPLKLLEQQLKFDDQIMGNRISKVPVFKISRGSEGAKRNFTYLFEGQIPFALKLSVGCAI